MSKNLYQDVLEFNRKFGLIQAKAPQLMPPQDAIFRLARMHEELAEMGKAFVNKDLVAIADSLADLTYFALGTAAQMGLPFDQVWNAVHVANMSKVRGQSKYLHSQDVIKPEGWLPPEPFIREAILNAEVPTGAK